MIQGGLFTRDFLIEGVRAEPAWVALTEERLQRARTRLHALLVPIVRHRQPNEAETEKDLVFPILEQVLDWPHWLPQQNQSKAGRSDVPDALLFADAPALERARPEAPWQRFRHGLCLVESKRWNRPLDRPAEGRGKQTGEDGVPSTQILRYLRRADDVTRGGLRWGILTNGRLWRLYWQGALSVAEDFLEIDLGKLFALPGCEADLLDQRGIGADHALRLFLLLFGREAFLVSEHGRTFHQVALEQGRRWEERVARDLSRVVFDEVFPVLASALARHDRPRPALPGPAWLEEVRQGALILLYRLLFVLYAEDRDLLPDERGPYAAYCLTRIRREVAEARAAGQAASPRLSIYWARLRSIFNAIAHGDDPLGIPPYNGGLFEAERAPILERVELPDAVVARIVFALSHVEEERGPKYVNYRDLSVQQLGSIYERILEFGLRLDGLGEVIVDRDDGERHDSGSYYTPEALVGLIIERTVGPAVAARSRRFEHQAERLRADRRPVEQRLAELAAADPASALLELKVCDPAMGSGHFLVSLVDWLADRVLAALADAPALVEWGNYVPPLLGRVAAVRSRILAEAAARGWQVTAEQLDDRHVIRRMILKRVVHGVDKNPFAVELAKVALWLHTFTVGAPLSFLDHHLRCGDSIVGAWVRETLDAVEAAGGLVRPGEVARIEAIAGAMTRIEEITDNDVAEVRASYDEFKTIGDATHGLAALFDLITARHALGVDPTPAPKRPRFTLAELRSRGADVKTLAAASKQQTAFARAAAWKALIEGQYGDPLLIATAELAVAAPEEDGAQPMLGEVGEADERRRAAAAIVAEARDVAARERFLHWEVAFPNAWRRLAQSVPDGGFDAVIGNPPYVRQERLAALKPALAAQYRVYAGMADLYVYFFEQGLRLVRPGGRVGYVVTNKWLKAGYAERLRALLTDPARAETEAVIDFGHARAFFPDADVFPNVVVARRPDGQPAPDTLQVAVPPRETLPDERLDAAVAAASFPLPRIALTSEGWTLEPKPVMDLLAKIKHAGVPLVDFAGVKPLYGIKTGFNEAFLIDTPTRDRLVAADPRSAEVIKPYLRGQDIGRWAAEWNGLHMIFARKGIELDSYRGIAAHLARFRKQLEPKPMNWRPTKGEPEWPGRKPGAYAWYEVQDPVEYWKEFLKPKIVVRRIEFYAQVAIDLKGHLLNDSALIIPTANKAVLSCLNSAVMWYYRFKTFPHKKDEALALDIPFVSALPLPEQLASREGAIADEIDRLLTLMAEVTRGRTGIIDWLRIEFGLDRVTKSLANPERLDADAFATAVRAALPRRRTLSAADIARLKREHADTIQPARLAAREAQRLERQLSDLVNQAYGLTPEDVALMWATAPPRMPPGNPADGDSSDPPAARRDP